MSEEVMHDGDGNRQSDSLQLPLDPDPFNLRFLLFMIFVISGIIGYFLSERIFSLGTCSLVAVFTGIMLGVGVMYIAEKILRPRWSSNRFLHLSPESVHVLDSGTPLRGVDPRQHVNVLLWYFKIERRSRVPAGWYVVALALEQDERYLPIYMLTSPEEFEKLLFSDLFTRLESRKERKQRNSQDLRLAGVQRRLAVAETARNIEGSEMQYDDFSRYVSWLQSQFPQWMPVS